MRLGVKLRPSRSKDARDPGHMGVYWTAQTGTEFRGFRFYVDDLPDAFQDPGHWREYLLHNTVPGYIFDDIILRDDYEHRSGLLMRRNWDLDESRLPLLIEETRPRPHGRYSFNPDRFECHNCVTWSVTVINGFLGPVLSRVREGRVRLMQAQLEALR